MELITEYIPATIICWAIMICAIWFLPEAIGFKGYTLGLKIGLSIVLLPISYFIIGRMANR